MEEKMGERMEEEGMTKKEERKVKKNRGFASMSPEKQKAIASSGGKAAHKKGTAHEYTSEEAREAGKKGGMIAHARGTAHRFTSEEARKAGAKSRRNKKKESL